MERKWALKFQKAESTKDLAIGRKLAFSGRTIWKEGEKPNLLDLRTSSSVTSPFQQRIELSLCSLRQKMKNQSFPHIQDGIRRVEAGSSPISRVAFLVDILFCSWNTSFLARNQLTLQQMLRRTRLLLPFILYTPDYLQDQKAEQHRLLWTSTGF